MQKLKYFRLLFSLAALLFVAKPFIGFAINLQINKVGIHTILTKSFIKRKPESIEEADENIKAIHHLLTEPKLCLLSTFSIMSKFPVSIPEKQNRVVINCCLYECSNRLVPPEKTYLLIGKLLI